MTNEEKIPFAKSAKNLEATIDDYFNQQDPMRMTMDDLAQEIEGLTEAGNNLLSIGLRAYSRVEYLNGILRARNTLASSMSDGL